MDPGREILYDRGAVLRFGDKEVFAQSFHSRDKQNIDQKPVARPLLYASERRVFAPGRSERYRYIMEAKAVKQGGDHEFNSTSQFFDNTAGDRIDRMSAQPTRRQRTIGYLVRLLD